MVDPEGVAARVERLAPLLRELESIRDAGRETYAAEPLGDAAGMRSFAGFAREQAG